MKTDSASKSSPQPFAWSVRRELWENRSIYLAPLIAAGVALFGFVLAARHLPSLRRTALLLDSVRQRAAIEMPYEAVAAMVMFTAFFVGVFYCLDALHGERRDRSILFWKSLPVSDFTTVLAKLTIPLVILPLVTFVTIEVTQLIVLLITTIALLPAGLAGTTLPQLPLGHLALTLLYGLVTMVLWQAPFYSWLLVVSAWARRATFLWAFLPWAALCMVEKIAFNSSYLAHLLGSRVTGNFDTAFVVAKQQHGAHVSLGDRLTAIDPLGFFTAPGLWLGLVIAAIFLVGAIQLRRARGPL